MTLRIGGTALYRDLVTPPSPPPRFFRPPSVLYRASDCVYGSSTAVTSYRTWQRAAAAAVSSFLETDRRTAQLHFLSPSVFIARLCL